MQTFNSKSQHLLLAFPFIMLLVGIVAVEVFNICSGLTFLLVTLLFLSISAPVWLNPELRRQAFYPYSYFAYQGMVSFALPSLLVWIDREVGTPLEPFPQSVLLISGAFWGYWIGFRSNWGGHLAKVIPLYAFPHSRTKWANRNLWAVTIILYGVGWLGRLYRANMGFSHLPTDYGHLRIYIGFFSDLASFATLSYVLMLYFLFKNSNRKLLFIPILVLVSFEVAAGALYGGRSAIVLPLLYLAMVYSLNSYRPIRWQTLVIAHILALIAIGPFLTAYRLHFYALLDQGHKPSFEMVTDTLGEMSNYLSDPQRRQDISDYRKDVIFGGSTFQSTLRVIDMVPSVYGFELGKTLIRDVALAFVPRVVWPDKPLVLHGRAFAIRFWEYDLEEELGSSTGIGMPAEIYYNFSWFGLMVFPFLGVLLRLLWVRYKYYAKIEGTHIIRMFFIIFFVANISVFFVDFIVDFVRNGLIYLFFMCLVNRRLPVRYRWINGKEYRILRGDKSN